ncbi:MAG: hypothetical protein V2A34_00260 [Lentisphaerota bacterium]
MSGVYVGIDPGKDGGIVAINGDSEVLIQLVTPTVNVAKKGKKREYLVDSMKTILEFGKIDFAVLEKTQAMPGQGGTSMHSLGRGDGLWEGILVGLGIRYQRVHPKTWQKLVHFDQGGDNPKSKSKIAAGRLFPGHDFRVSNRAKKPHDGLIDAALMAIYAKTTYGASHE